MLDLESRATRPIPRLTAPARSQLLDLSIAAAMAVGLAAFAAAAWLGGPVPNGAGSGSPHS